MRWRKISNWKALKSTLQTCKLDYVDPEAQADEPHQSSLPVFDEQELKTTGIEDLSVLGDQLVFDQRVGTCLILNQDKDSVTLDFDQASAPKKPFKLLVTINSVSSAFQMESWKIFRSAAKTSLRIRSF